MMLQFLQVITFVLSIIINGNLVFMSHGFYYGSSYCGTYVGGSSFNRSCVGYGLSIQPPFWISSGFENPFCKAYPGFKVRCEGTKPVMNISNHRYYLQEIGMDSKFITLVDVDVDGAKCPRPRHNFSLQSQPFLHYYSYSERLTIFYNCTIAPPPTAITVTVITCLENSYNNKTRRSYAFHTDYDNNNKSAYAVPEGFHDWYNYCDESVAVPVDYYPNATAALKRPFRLRWSLPVDCDDCVYRGSGGQCSANDTTGGGFRCQCKDGTTVENYYCPDPQGTQGAPVPQISQATVPRGVQGAPVPQIPQATVPRGSRIAGSRISIRLKITIGVSIGVGGLLLIVLLIYRSTVYSLYNSIVSWKNKIDRPTNVEAFLENYGSLSLQRYKYSDVKKMTNSFKETLGQGGYGIVYKGKLHDDCLVAVKVLNESKGNGEDFINEVTAIGGTNHVNVVRLLGFCIEGNKRALVYEFMSNGSLERFIYNNQQSSTTSTPLGWEKLYDIALGVARGLEYLHRGCNTRILHLDIKPHNILLDQKFCPKISDFGLAKLCPTLASEVSMVGARGTMGYIAPEVCCRNFGGVSHKSDVYSYGMMVLEMIGGRKNIDATVVNISQIYFPHWIYNHLEQGNKVHESEECDVEGSGETFENEKAKKMIIVALWCIQPHPIDRPSMKKVAEMLEGNIEELQMPPNPNMGPQSKYSPSP